MNTKLSALSSTRVKRALDNLDLDCIKIKIMDSKEGLGWTRQQADEAAKVYKRFLYLAAVYDVPVVPTEQVDKFWHQHILDTRKYAADCQEIFGYFLHHFPYLGMRGEEDAANLKRQFDKTQQLYSKEFGESYIGDPQNCNSPNCSACMGCVSNAKAADLVGLGTRPSFQSLAVN